MWRFLALVLISGTLAACGQSPAIPARPPITTNAVRSLEADPSATRELIRAGIKQFLVRHHQGMEIERLYISKSAPNGIHSFNAIARGAGKSYRIEGHFQLAARLLVIEFVTPFEQDSQ